MFLLFIIQLSVSIGALAITHDQQGDLMQAGWERMPPGSKIKEHIQSAKNCCGFKNKTIPTDNSLGHPDCTGVSTSDDSCSYQQRVSLIVYDFILSLMCLQIRNMDLKQTCQFLNLPHKFGLLILCLSIICRL